MDIVTDMPVSCRAVLLCGINLKSMSSICYNSTYVPYSTCSLLPDLALGVEAIVVRLIIVTIVGTQAPNKAAGIETDLISIQDLMRIKERGSAQIFGVQNPATMQQWPARFRFQGLRFSLDDVQRAILCSLQGSTIHECTFNLRHGKG